jgi:hypothetical protein
MNPDEYGTRGAGSGKRERARPDVEIKTIFRNPGCERIDIPVRLVLDAVVAELRCGTHTGPVRGGLRRPPPKRTDRRRGVRNPAKNSHAACRIDDSFESARINHDTWCLNAMRFEQER